MIKMVGPKLAEKDIFEIMPVRKAVLTLAVPTVISQLIVLIYNLADTWFIGQTGDVLIDPLLIFGLHMNVGGAALATCISNVVSALYLLQHIILFGLVELSAPWLVRFFISDVSTVEYGAVFTRLRCISLPFINIEFMLISVFQGIGGAKQALILSFFRKGIFDLPVMFLANLLWPMYGLMIVEPVMEFMGGSIAVFLYRRQAFVECRSST